MHAAVGVGCTGSEERECFAIWVVGGCPMFGRVIRSESINLLDALKDGHLDGVIWINLSEMELTENTTCEREEEAPDQAIKDYLVPSIFVA
jgi:hypothetical protein